MMNKVRAGETITVSKNVKDFLNIEDLVRAFRLAMERNIEGGIYNIGSAQGVSMEELARLIMKTLGSKTNLEVSGDRFSDNMVLSIEKFKAATGWAPQVSLPEGLKHKAESSSPVSAMPGGIDLNPDIWDLEIEGEGGELNLAPDFQQVRDFNIDGLTPFIINIAPVTDIRFLLGITPGVPAN